MRINDSLCGVPSNDDDNESRLRLTPDPEELPGNRFPRTPPAAADGSDVFPLLAANMDSLASVGARSPAPCASPTVDSTGDAAASTSRQAIITGRPDDAFATSCSMHDSGLGDLDCRRRDDDIDGGGGGRGNDDSDGR